MTQENPFLSDVHKDGKIDLADIYVDTRTFLSKANSTKFMIVAFTLILSPFLLYYGLLSEETYREIIIVVSLTYLGVDMFEKYKMMGK